MFYTYYYSVYLIEISGVVDEVGWCDDDILYQYIIIYTLLKPPSSSYYTML